MNAVPSTRSRSEWERLAAPLRPESQMLKNLLQGHLLAQEGALTHRFCYRRISVASPRCYQRPEAQNARPCQQASETGTPRSIT